MIPAMRDIGERFSRNEVYVPEMLIAARAMHGGMEVLEPVLAGYLGVFLLGFFFLAVGTFCSTLTNNQLIAAIIAFAAMVALFSIGLVELNMDGTPKLDAQGREIETYDNYDVVGLARVFMVDFLAQPAHWIC